MIAAVRGVGSIGWGLLVLLCVAWPTPSVAAEPAAGTEIAQAGRPRVVPLPGSEQPDEEGEQPPERGGPVHRDAEPPEGRPRRVGRPPERRDERPEVTTLQEVGGVLTKPGTLRIEPTFEFQHSSISRFNVRGFEVVQGAVIIGVIEAFESDRDTLRQVMTVRAGLTPRLEIDLSVPGVYRDERFTSAVPVLEPGTSTPVEVTERRTDYGLGDVEFGAHYQLNRATGDWPYFVANVRVKSDTGTGPFDVDRDRQGVEEELATGSGFWGVSPSITMIAPQGPAVLFGNIGYLWNIERDVDEEISLVNDLRVGEVDPGDSISFNVGLGLAATDDLSFNLGFNYSHVTKTRTEFILDSRSGNPRKRDGTSSELQVGSVLFGIGYKLSRRLSTNINVAIGATEDAPDYQVNLRFPFTVDVPKIAWIQ